VGLPRLGSPLAFPTHPKHTRLPKIVWPTYPVRGRRGGGYRERTWVWGCKKQDLVYNVPDKYISYLFSSPRPSVEMRGKSREGFEECGCLRQGKARAIQTRDVQPKPKPEHWNEPGGMCRDNPASQIAPHPHALAVPCLLPLLR